MPERASDSHLHHQLTAGQMAMVACGGSIGTGLLLGSGAALQIAGPAVVISFAIAAAIAFSVTMALGELASMHPGAGSFGIYADLYLNRWAGFASRYAYWLSIMMSVASGLVAAATYVHFWFPQFSMLWWIGIFAVLLFSLNLLEVGRFGSFEYWFAMIKVIVIFAFIVLGGAILFGGQMPAQYTTNGGFFPHGARGPLLAVAFGLFSFLGTEMIAISSGEARSAAIIPRATKLTFLLLAIVYLGAPAVLAGILPWNTAGVAESPFVTVFRAVHIPAAAGVVNFVVLTAGLSGANASLYATSRMIYSLACSGYAPASLRNLTRSGVPRASLLLSMIGILIVCSVAYFSPENAYLYIIGASAFGGLFAWGLALLAHIRMRRRLSPDQLAALPMRSPGGKLLSGFGLLALIAVVVSTYALPQTRVISLTAIPMVLLVSVMYAAMQVRQSSGS